MATIRIPQEASHLLPLCRSHSGDTHDRPEQICFETYADLMVFAAALGYEEMGGKLPMRETRFLDRPNPIDLQTFKNDRRYPPILLIALAASKDRAVVRDEDLLCKIAEDFAAVGCERLKKAVDRGVPGGWHLAIAKRLANSVEAPSEDQI
jgi:dnd system-associated protein 4